MKRGFAVPAAIVLLAAFFAAQFLLKSRNEAWLPTGPIRKANRGHRKRF